MRTSRIALSSWALSAWFKKLGYQYIHGTTLCPDGPAPERVSYKHVVLEERFRNAINKLNLHLPTDAQEDVVRRVLRLDSPSLEENNHAFHRMLTKGVEVQVRKDGAVRGDLGWLIDFNSPDNNDWLVVNQYTIQGEAFSRAIRGDGEVPTPLEDSIRNMAVIEALFRSGESGQWETPGPLPV